MPRTPLTPARALASWIPALAWAGGIFYASSLPGSAIPGRFGNAAHVGEYLVFGVLLFVALLPGRTPRRAAVLALLLASAYGISDEFHQSFVPMRTPDVADWGRDTLGALLGVSAAVAAVTWRATRKRSTRS